MEEWTCTCGQKNTSKFCTACGKERSTEKIIRSQSPEQKKNHTIVGLVCVIGFLIISIGYLLTRESQNVAEITEFNAPAKNIPEEADAPLITVDTNAWKKDALALNDIYIGSSKEEVHSRLGLESAITDPDMHGHLHYQYPSMEVIITEGIVTALVSKDEYSSTPLNIHQGSSLQEAISAYGQADSFFEHNGMILYEYKKIASTGQNCLLRFAVENNVVNYISIRVIDPLPNNSQVGARETFKEYYELISNKKYIEAYQILSPAQQTWMGTLSDFVQGHSETISSTVTSLTAKVQSYNGVIFDYTLEAKDRLPDGRIKIQIFQGTVTLVYNEPRWIIDYAKSAKVSERIE